jgi:HEPN domain-containing protein
MSPERHPPTDPREWLNRARSSLAKTRIRGDEIYLEDLCFDAQQAAEKAIKAIGLAAYQSAERNEKLVNTEAYQAPYKAQF